MSTTPELERRVSALETVVAALAGQPEPDAEFGQEIRKRASKLCTEVAAICTQMLTTARHGTPPVADAVRLVDTLAAALEREHLPENQAHFRKEQFRCHGCGRLLAASEVASHKELHGLVTQETRPGRPPPS